ncbi:ABC transporter permease [Paludibaculum fermentans]|uniref:ABC transporter permease n=1 Tax=Paludibaculum fermentans TaxID=1473598 RepID=UPI003EB8A550
MALPFSYNLRNLLARRTTTIMTALGIALTVAVLLSILTMVEGLRVALAGTGHPLNLLVMRKGSTAELNSTLTQEAFRIMRTQPGIARDARGEPLASLELVTVIVLENPAIPSGININVRGLTQDGLAIRGSGIRLTQGRMFQPGRREVVVGQGIAHRYPMARLGGTLQFGKGDWQVVGVMDAGRSAANSELFCDLYQLASDQNRETTLSSALLRASGEVSMQALLNTLVNDNRLHVVAVPERKYYAEQSESGRPVLTLGVFVAIIMAVGSSFASMNTMYASVAQRSAEIGTLRVLGFSRLGILTSFVLESLLLSLFGGILGCLLVLPLNNLETGIGNSVTFSEITFHFRATPSILAGGIAFALLVGGLGGLIPAASAARKEIVAALRQL